MKVPPILGAQNRGYISYVRKVLLFFVRKYVIMKLPLLAAGRCATNAGGFLLTGT